MDNILKSSQENLLVEAETTLPEYCLAKAEEHLRNGKLIWITDTISEESHSFENFESETRKVASFLYKRGMRKGDTFLYMTYDLVHIHVIMTGVWRANGIVRASYPEEDEESINERIEESHSKWILCEKMHVEMLARIKAKLGFQIEIIVVGVASGFTSLSEIFEDDGLACPKLEITKDDPAVIFSTSGTTGKCKGAVYTHDAFLNVLVCQADFFPLMENHPNLLASKGTHVTGIIFPFEALISGKTTLVMSTITKENIFNAVHKYKPGFIWGFPTFLLQLVNDPAAAEFDFSSLKIAASGGAVITPTIEQTLRKLPNLEYCSNLYGMTETCPIASSVDPISKRIYKDTPPFSVGKVPPGAKVIIRDPESGKILGAHERGEICIKTRRNFSYYLNNPQNTADSFVEGFFRTGDLGYFDENRFLFMVERLKELIKYGNNHIAPSELEEVISQHESVKQVCVFGIEDPRGNDTIPRAVVTVKTPGTTTAQEILEFANARLASYKQLRGGLYIVEELPKGKTGKVMRNLVAAMQL